MKTLFINPLKWGDSIIYQHDNHPMPELTQELWVQTALMGATFGDYKALQCMYLHGVITGDVQH